MKLRIFSDIHLEFAPFSPPTVSADVVVLAGDIGEGLAGVEWARKQFPNDEIIYVAGNHEFYGNRLPNLIADLSMRAQALGVHFLENRSIVLGDARFLGATLWTDYAIYARNEEEAGRYMAFARRKMNDYRRIRFGERRRKRRDRILPGHLLEMHRESRAWLASELAKPFTGRTVVVTHHAPLSNSVPPHYSGDDLTPCYASHMPELLRSPVDLWVHGHMHESIDYMIDGTRLIANPRGYAPPDDNPAFDDALVVEI